MKTIFRPIADTKRMYNQQIAFAHLTMPATPTNGAGTTQAVLIRISSAEGRLHFEE
jgi:hypothetical protein